MKRCRSICRPAPARPCSSTTDFREKSLRHTHQGTDAAVVFDAFPGHVFRAHVTSSDAGILAGQEAVNGQLSEPETSNRWVRDAPTHAHSRDAG